VFGNEMLAKHKSISYYEKLRAVSFELRDLEFQFFH